ncbi:pyrroline-5-carboxylate reductase [Pseudaestuariivita sp.]|uniref:pyrroline-5-carboxylate reductase n=1 Tax=Pseudaestuariivita sp. TaxID=2211669 RepID=UPI0040581612
MDIFERITERGIVLLGCGKMGSAMLAGWLKGGLPASAVHVVDPNPSDWLKGTGVHINQALPEAPAVALLAVKPQMMATALPTLQGYAGGGTLFVSVAAGTTIANYAAILGQDTPVVRAMPNTPAAVAQGITALVRNDAATEAHLDATDALMQAIGAVVRLTSEDQMDAVTGVSGSGPAYVFHMIETLAAAGEAAGLGPELATTLAQHTVAGAGALSIQSDENAEQLRINVTSPNGTTQAGLEVLMEELPDLMRRTVQAATNRSRELQNG